MQINFSRSRWEPVNSTAHAIVCSTGRKKCAFLGGSSASYPQDLRNFLVEQLIVARDCTIFVLSSPAGRNCAIFPLNSDRNIFTILELNRLPNRIAQFFEGMLVSL